MESSEKILNNYDVLQLIFRYLDFKDHLKLIKICPQFEDAIVVWRLSYENLYIAQILGDTFRLQHDAVNNVMTKHSLTPEAIYIILQHTSMHIQKLELVDIRCLENIISLKYHNLTDLSLRETVVQGNHLQQLAKNCLNLQSLSLQSRNLCFIKDLIRFENLTKLSITLLSDGDSITDNVLTQINNACPKLYELSLTDCHFKFKGFPRMNNLMHLAFTRCWNARLEKFEQIFPKLKFKSLSLVDVVMSDETADEDYYLNYNYSSNTLETLNIANVLDQNIVRTFFDGEHIFENVSKVRILENEYRDYRGTGSTKLCFSHNFPNLQELIMDSYHISTEDMLHLEHLKVLQFDLFDNMTWSYLKILFQHPTLTHITITPIDCQDFEMHYEHLTECCKCLTTTLEYLSLPSVVYESALSFWQSFRQRNKLLKLKIVDSD